MTTTSQALPKLHGGPHEEGGGATLSSSSSVTMPLQFSPFSTKISPSFWTTLARIKIDKLQLSDDTLDEVMAHFTFGKSIVDRATSANAKVRMAPSVALDAGSLDHVAGSASTSSSTSTYPLIKMRGSLKNFNTIEDFKKADKSALLQAEGVRLLEHIMNDDDPSQHLSRFLLFCFADLKKYKFVYWFAFPALVVQPAWNVIGEWQDANRCLGSTALQTIANVVQERHDELNGVFLATTQGKVGRVMDNNTFFRGVDENDCIVGFLDPSALPATPGWPLRNLLTLLACRFNVRSIRTLCLREDISESIVAHIRIQDDEVKSPFKYQEKELPLATATTSVQTSMPSVVGWERNASGKLAPKMADLGPLMDPARLADQAVDLNLKLMRWRILPEIDLDRIKQTRCLLLGAGTLGCYVARTLLAWGVRHITLVDSSTVSFSNPVRQPLFTFDDCLHGGKPKAECAANALRSIYPGAQANGIALNVPMPGHPVPPGSVEQVKADVQRLEELFDTHDVVYLLMDSRESRWLPTVLGAAKGKLVMNTALGFDSFLAMRHGASPMQHAQAQQQQQQQRLGCYFCNDIVAPSDSLTDRTLDQMCTVTRPGLAAVASASTVEMMVSLLQHPLGALAPAFVNASSQHHQRRDHGEQNENGQASSILGHLPHQIRGTLFTFQNLLIHGPAYEKCTACSETVVNAYHAEGFDVVQKACNDEAYLRSLTGLDKLYDATDDIEVEWSEEDDDNDKGEEGDGELL